MSVVGTISTTGCSGSTKRLGVEGVGLYSEGGKGTSSGDILDGTPRSETIEGTTEGVFGGGVGGRSTGTSATSDRGVLCSEGIVLHTDAVSYCVEPSQTQISAVR